MIFQHSTLILSASILVIAVAQYYDDNNDQRESGGWDPTHRDFTQRCMELAQLAGPKGCDLFLLCCSESQVLNKLNADKCQEADSSNDCTINDQTSRIEWSQCKARNCTPEITTTTTTTPRPHYPLNSASLISVTMSTILLLAVAMVFKHI